MLQRIIVFVLRSLSFFRANQIDLDRVMGWVLEAEEKLEKGEDKNEFVRTKVREVLRISAPYLIDMIVGMAVGYLGKRGEINLKELS